jgi:SpoVK/Ycf46/Vps4 family AAA+-type ATPase
MNKISEALSPSEPTSSQAPAKDQSSAAGFGASGNSGFGRGGASAHETQSQVPGMALPANANIVDLMCVRFALKAVLDLGAKFNLRRDINNLVTLSARFWVWPQPTLERLKRFIDKRCAELDAWKGIEQLSLEDFLAKHGTWNGLYDDSSLFYFLDEFVKLNGKDMLAVFAHTRDAIDARVQGRGNRLSDNIGRLATVLDLTAGERAILMHASLCKYQRDLRPVLVDCKASSAQEAYAMMGHILGITGNEVGMALKAGGRLETLGLIDTPIAEHAITDLGDLMRISDRLLAILTAEYENDAAMMAAFTRPAGATTLSLADYPHVEQDVRYLIALLNAASKRKEKGINVLVYGPPGTGKTELAKLIASQAQCELYEVDCLDRDGNSLSGKERYRSLQVSQAFLRGRDMAALLFDEVEDVFPPIGQEMLNIFGSDDQRGASVGGKAWINHTLEQNPVPTIWISNAIGQIDPAYRRRFQFHLELANPPQCVRENIARKYLGDMGVSEDFIAKLSARKQVTPAQIQSAMRFAQLAQHSIDEPVEDLLLTQLERSDKALGQKDKRDEFRPNVTQYNLDLLNIESRHPVEKIIKAMQLRARATLCFYGAPGTGKTALAEHIAKSLEKPLMMKRASDLMSKYVGETEQQMAKMFEDAKREGAILLLDEADSFLQNRQMAQRNYEVSEVNEMLQGMERFDGIFICTTNLFDRIDEAALRRFSFKIKFMPLTAPQREAMFIAEALAADASGFDQDLKTRLARLNLLTPGDFAAVRRQAVLLEENMTADEFLLELEREHKVKPDVRYARSIGFNS